MARKGTLYVSDMDGTLLGTDSRVSPASAELMQQLVAEGALFTVATARTPATVVPLLAQAPVSVDAIVMTGAATWNLRQGAFADVHTIPEEWVVHILALCAEHAIHPFIYVLAADGATLDVYHGAAAFNKAEESFYLQRCHLPLKRFHLGRLLPVEAFRRCLLFYAMGPAEAINPVAEALRRETDLAVSCYPDIFNPAIANLEILAPGVSKAAAIRRTAERLGVNRIVVFGDNLNDLPMFAVADTSVAVANALPQVREAADIVIGANYTDAVPRFILDEQ